MDENSLIDGVERRLRQGRFLVLIIGDGIQEGVQDLTSYLQMHAGIHANLALVDLSIWMLPNEGMLVVPRVPMQTTTIERGIVSVVDGGISIRAPEVRPSSSGYKPRSQSASEDEFLLALGTSAPNDLAAVRSLMSALSDAGIDYRFGSTTMIIDIPVRGTHRSILQVKTNGNLDGGTILNGVDREGPNGRQIVTALDEIGRLADAAVTITPGWVTYKTRDGRASAPFRPLASREAELVSVLVRLRQDLLALEA